jgi:hypothetical protein
MGGPGMIWLTWRQHRRQALFTAIALAVLAALMIPTGLAMHNTFADKGLDDCVPKLDDAGLARPVSNACHTALQQFNDQYETLIVLVVLFFFLPLLVGLFWGAPLVAREVENGTHRLVWTQGISRRRWALVKFGFAGADTLAAAVIYGLGLSWWITPLSQAGLSSRFSTLLFDMQGVAPIGYTLFAVALGVFAGTVWHKVLPAMAVTLVGFTGLRIVLAVLARPRYLPARTRTYSVLGVTREPNTARGDWIISQGVRNPDGRLVMHGEIACPPNPTGPGASGCGTGFGLKPGAYNWQLYQPGSRFWLFQGIEAGIFVALALLLLYVAIRRIRSIA